MRFGKACDSGQIEPIDAGDLRDVGIGVMRQGEVAHEQVGLPGQHLLQVFAGDQQPGGAGGTDQDVGAAQLLVEIDQLGTDTADRFGQPANRRGRASDDGDPRAL